MMSGAPMNGVHLCFTGGRFFADRAFRDEWSLMLGSAQHGGEHVPCWS
jgi:hypothetical protein